MRTKTSLMRILLSKWLSKALNILMSRAQNATKLSATSEQLANSLTTSFTSLLQNQKKGICVLLQFTRFSDTSTSPSTSTSCHSWLFASAPSCSTMVRFTRTTRKASLCPAILIQAQARAERKTLVSTIQELVCFFSFTEIIPWFYFIFKN